MIQIKDWIAIIPEQERRIAYVGENASESRQFRLVGSGLDSYAYYLDLAFDLSTVTTTAKRQKETTSQNVQETVGTNQSQSVSTKTTENAILSETTIDCDAKTDVVPLSILRDEEGITLTWTILAQHTQLPGALQATLRAVSPDGCVKKSAVMIFEVEPAVIATAAKPPALSEAEQIIQNMESQYATYVAKATECEEQVAYLTSAAASQCRNNLNESYAYMLNASDAATAAESAKTAAAGSATAANASAETAAAAAANAATSETAANHAKTAAETAKESAENAQISAGLAATAAGNSATTAAAAAETATAKAAAAAASAASMRMQLIGQITTTEAVKLVDISADIDGAAFALDRFCLLIQFPTAITTGYQTGQTRLAVYANNFSTGEYCLYYQDGNGVETKHLRMEGEIMGNDRCITSIATGKANVYGNPVKTGRYGSGFATVTSLQIKSKVIDDDTNPGIPAGTVLTLYGRKA